MNVNGNGQVQQNMQVQLAQNITGVLAQNNQGILLSIGAAGAAFEAFVTQARQQQAAAAAESAALRARIVALETEKANFAVVHNQQIAALQATINTLTATVNSLSSTVTALSNKVTGLETLLLNHKHAVTITFAKPGNTGSYATTKIGGLQ